MRRLFLGLLFAVASCAASPATQTASATPPLPLALGVRLDCADAPPAPAVPTAPRTVASLAQWGDEEDAARAATVAALDDCRTKLRDFESFVLPTLLGGVALPEK